MRENVLGVWRQSGKYRAGVKADRHQRDAAHDEVFIYVVMS